MLGLGRDECCQLVGAARSKARQLCRVVSPEEDNSGVAVAIETLLRVVLTPFWRRLC